jgi:serine O-acetyltransferase
MSLKDLPFDIKACSNSSSPWVNFKCFAFNHTSHLLVLIRLGQDLYRIPLLGKLLGFIVEYSIRILYASDISCRAQIGRGCQILHGHDIVIGAHVVIGENCKIFNGVTLGNKDLSLPSKGNQPWVGNHVVLGTGCKLLGPIRLGDHTVVGANSVVITDCPCHSLAVGVPARIKEKKG